MTKNRQTKAAGLLFTASLLAFGLAMIGAQAETRPMSSQESTGLLNLAAEQEAFLSLKSNIEVAGTHVTLGDIFTLEGPSSLIPVVRAPKPGRRMAIPAGALARFVYKQGLRWDNEMQLRQVYVQRRSTEIRNEDIQEALELAFLDMDLAGDYDIKMRTGNLVIHQPEDRAREISVESLNHDPATGRFVAEVRTPLDDGESQLTTVSGKTIEVRNVPVLTGPVPRGEIIEASDIETIRMPVKMIGANFAGSDEDVVGMEAKRSLRPGQPLRTTDVSHPTLVRKGALVTMVFDAPGIRLTNVGKSLENGSLGDIINIVNPKSRQTVMAQITALNQVTVSVTSMQMAMAR